MANRRTMGLPGMKPNEDPIGGAGMDIQPGGPGEGAGPIGPPPEGPGIGIGDLGGGPPPEQDPSGLGHGSERPKFRGLGPGGAEATPQRPMEPTIGAGAGFTAPGAQPAFSFMSQRRAAPGMMGQNGGLQGGGFGVSQAHPGADEANMSIQDILALLQHGQGQGGQ